MNRLLTGKWAFVAAVAAALALAPAGQARAEAPPSLVGNWSGTVLARDGTVVPATVTFEAGGGFLISFGSSPETTVDLHGKYRLVGDVLTLEHEGGAREVGRVAWAGGNDRVVLRLDGHFTLARAPAGPAGPGAPIEN
jgi:uncharacterized protein (TIGR03066 family)